MPWLTLPLLVYFRKVLRTEFVLLITLADLQLLEGIDKEVEIQDWISVDNEVITGLI